MSVQDSYVGRGFHSQGSVSANEQAIARALAAKSNAVRRLERLGYRTKPVSRKQSWAA
ncbi:MAG TPA: hypothetical protein VGB55_00410 [Tepidisphaeraceae bacterium]|jgi:hypothetical protein